MTHNLQRYERHVFYDLPVCCVFCGRKVLDLNREESLLDPCEHTLFVAHDEGYEFLADRTVAQLRARGFVVHVEDNQIEVEPSGEDNRCPSPDEVTSALDFPDGLKISSYVGPPGGLASYVGFAPMSEA